MTAGSLPALVAAVEPADGAAREAAAARHDLLAKPPGSLGRLEALGARLAAIAGRSPPPAVTAPALVVAAGDHGVHAQGVSAWPREVTAEVVAALCRGGAAAAVLAEVVGARLAVLDVGVAGDLPDLPDLHAHRVRAGTRDLTVEPAMTAAEAGSAVAAGAEVAANLLEEGADCLAVGDVGMANTTASAALVGAYTGRPAAEVTGPGAGLDAPTLVHKRDLVAAALERHRLCEDPAEVLAALGGLEHAALVGVILAGAGARVPVVLDGLAADAAALAAVALCPVAAAYLVAGHGSLEPGAAVALRHLGLVPLLDLDLRLGEGTGALLALPLVRSAAAVLREMATLSELGIPR